MNRKISVIIPVWNGEKYLTEAIESALNQDYENKEIIVVNDGSSDRSEEIIQTFGNRIRHVYQENKGLGASRNTGVRLSTGTYLTFLDQDDLWEKTKLSMQMTEMIRSQNEDPLIFSRAKQFICSSLSEEERKVISIPHPILAGYIAGTLLVSKDRFNQIGYFFEEKKIGEFMDWYLRAIEINIPVKMIEEVTFYRRIHLTNMGRQTSLFNRTDYLKVLKASLTRRRHITI